MADARFFTRGGPFTLQEIAAETGATLEGADNPARPVSDVAALDAAGSNDISFLDNVKYTGAFRASKAGACFVRPKLALQAPKGMALLVSEEPYTAYAKCAQMFYAAAFEPFISPAAHIGKNVKIGAGCRVEAGAWIDDGVVIGNSCWIGANAAISHAIIGNRVILHRSVNIGQDGFGFAPAKHGILKVPQLGRVVIGNDVEIGAGTCVDRGSGPDTLIGDFAKIDNLVQIAHNCVIGRGAIVVAQVGLAGSSRVEDGAQLGGQAGVAGHLTIGRGARVAAQGGVMRDVAPGETVGGTPAVPVRDWHRQTAVVARLAKKKGAVDE